MKTDANLIRILAYGDSNTWGRKPGNDNESRYPINVRWTGRLQILLGDKYEVIEEGLNGRTTNIESPHKRGKNGRDYLLPCLESHKPLDVVILALGKNDLKSKYDRTPGEITRGLEECISAFQAEARDREGKLPNLIIISPGIVEEVERLRDKKFEVDFLGAKDKSKKLSTLYKIVSDKCNATYVNLSKIIKVSEIDGVHLNASEHQKIAIQLERVVRGLMINR